MKLPCDLCMWGLIPMIKREIVLQLYKEHKLSKVSIAGKLGVTKGSVTQYIQGKRAADSKKIRKGKKISAAINRLARDMVEREVSEKDISKSFCNICKLAQKEYKVC